VVRQAFQGYDSVGLKDVQRLNAVR
jgi:hypothetical protein